MMSYFDLFANSFMNYSHTIVRLQFFSSHFVTVKSISFGTKNLFLQIASPLTVDCPTVIFCEDKVYRRVNYRPNITIENFKIRVLLTIFPLSLFIRIQHYPFWTIFMQLLVIRQAC